MRVRHLYLALCALGVVVPYAQFVPWLSENVATLVVGVSLGFPLFLFMRQRVRDATTV